MPLLVVVVDCIYMVCLFTFIYLLCHFIPIDVAWMPPEFAAPYSSGVLGVGFFFFFLEVLFFWEPCLSELLVNSWLSSSTWFPFHYMFNFSVIDYGLAFVPSQFFVTIVFIIIITIIVVVIVTVILISEEIEGQ